MKERAAPEYWVLDGLEDSPRGKLARLEQSDGKIIILPASILPVNTREGDVLEVMSGPDGEVLKAAPYETERRREVARQQLNALNRPAATGEIDL